MGLEIGCCRPEGAALNSCYNSCPQRCYSTTAFRLVKTGIVASIVIFVIGIITSWTAYAKGNDSVQQGGVIVAAIAFVAIVGSILACAAMTKARKVGYASINKDVLVWTN